LFTEEETEFGRAIDNKENQQSSNPSTNSSSPQKAKGLISHPSFQKLVASSKPGFMGGAKRVIETDDHDEEEVDEVDIELSSGKKQSHGSEETARTRGAIVDCPAPTKVCSLLLIA
jgi:hypothetical protein